MKPQPQRPNSDDCNEDNDSDWDLPEGDLSTLNLSYEEPVIAICGHSNSGANANIISVPTTSLGKRKEAPSPSECNEKSFVTGKRARLSDEGQRNCKLNDPSVPHIIAHCPRVHLLMEAVKLPQGVLFELARLITIGRLQYKDITKEKLEILSMQGNNDTAVPLISQVFQRDRLGSDSPPSVVEKYFSEEFAATYPWKELDREEAALSRGPYEGLGNNANEPGWYGGKVEFRGRLKSQGKGKPYEIVLDSCALGPSSRFSRRFGSSSFLRVKIPLNMFHDSNNNLNLFFKKPFIIWGKVFRACYAKDDNIFLYWTDESYPFGSPTIPGRLSFEEFIDWHNPIQHNSLQLMTKWATRTTLGFSNSVPGPRVRQHLIREINDITSDMGSDMTDGCGLVTKSVTRALLDQFSLSFMPTAFQFRLGGCKGMLVFHNDENPESQDSEHCASVRPSQIKIRYPFGVLDPAMLTFDVLRTSRLSSPSKISSEIIINLADNGVPRSIFADLLKRSIRDMFEALTTWQGPDAMFNLWMNVERHGGVLCGRRVREAVGEARARGYTNRSPEDAELDDNADEDGMDDFNIGSAPRSVAWWADQISGCPSSLEETVMVLLDSGFRPQECPILREKLRKVVSYKVDNKTQNLRFELKQSCTAFAVPDPYNVLGPNEIQIKSSRRNLQGEDGLLTDIITGDVLIARNPCKLPSDIRKVKAVDHPLLRNYLDVIVFSVQGHRRLIDYLAGGDYDGDVVLALWAANIVSPFNNADEKYSLDPVGLDLAFARDTETGSTFLARMKDAEPEVRIHAMQTYLLGALVDPSLIGKYSAMHTNAIYQLGLGHPRTHKLAAKFARVLDSSKNGYRIKPETISADTKQYFHPRGPQWQVASKEKKRKSSKPRFDTSNEAYLQRDYTSPYVKGIFIMDHLREVANRERERLLIEVDQVFAPLLNEPDPALVAPWEAAVKWAKMPTNNKESAKSKDKVLCKIAIHVQAMYRKNKGVFARAREQSSAVDASSKSGSEFTHLSIEVRQDELRALSKAFVSEPLLEDVPDIPDQETLDRWRASYAYKYDAEQNFNGGEQGWSRFPWNVALRELCAIKARSIGPYKVVSNSFYERFKLVNH